MRLPHEAGPSPTGWIGSTWSAYCVPPAAAPPNCPQPLLANLPQLVDGSDIEAELRAELSKDLPPTAQRAVQGSADQHTQARAGSSAAIRIGQKDETLHVVVTNSSPNDLRFPSPDPTTAWSACTSARTARRQRQRGPPRPTAATDSRYRTRPEAMGGACEQLAGDGAPAGLLGPDHQAIRALGGDVRQRGADPRSRSRSTMTFISDC